MRRMKKPPLFFTAMQFLFAILLTLISAQNGDPAEAQGILLPVVEERQVLVNSQVSLSCPTEKERPEWWQMNNFAIVEANSDGPVTGKPNVAVDGKNLIISNISFADQGPYSCSDTASPMARFNIKVHALPISPVIWALPPDSSSTAENQQQKVTCESRYGRPVANIKWKVDGNDREPKTAEIRQESNGTLTILSTIEVNVGKTPVHVSCTAEHPNQPEDAPQQVASTNLRTYTLPTPVVQPARLENLRAGQTIVVDCRIPDTTASDNQYTRPSLVWTLADGFERQQVVIENGFIVNRMTLIVDREMNNKALSCRSELSYARSVSVNLEMKVKFAPSKPILKLSFPKRGQSEIGIDDLGKMKVTCDDVQANPPATVRFLINGAEVNTTSLSTQANTKVQLAASKQVGDSVRSTGKRTVISCIAYNFIGSGASDSVPLPVYSPPTMLRVKSISRSQQIASDIVSNSYSYRSGVNATFFCDMHGGQSSPQAKARWSLKCPDESSPEKMVEKIKKETDLEIDEADSQHARTYFSYDLTKNEDECQLTCQAIDPIAGNSPITLQPLTINIFYGPEEINLRFAQAAAYNDGETIQAICETGASKPQPEVKWEILSPGPETATSIPSDVPALQCTEETGAPCNATIEFVARAELNNSIVRCTATNPTLGVIVATDRRLEILYKPRAANPSRCFSRFIAVFGNRHNLTEHCLFEANPPVDPDLTQILLVAAGDSSKKRRLSYDKRNPKPWETVRIERRFDNLDHLNYLDSIMVITLQNRVGASEFHIPVRMNQSVISLNYINPSTMQDEIWVGDPVEVVCTINSMYQVAGFSFDASLVRPSDHIQPSAADSRTVTLTIPSIQQDVELAGGVRRVGCVAEFPANLQVKNITETRDVPINRAIEAVGVYKSGHKRVICRPIIGGGGRLQYRWWRNGVEVNGGQLSDENWLPLEQKTKYECEITQSRGDQVLSVEKSETLVHGYTDYKDIYFDLNVTAIRVFSSAAEFVVSKKPLPEISINPNNELPAAELRVSLQRAGNQHEYKITVLIKNDWEVFNITDLMPGSTYNFTFWTPRSGGKLKIVSSTVVTTTGAALAVLRLRPEETAIIVILSAVSAALFFLFCNIFVCIKIRRKRQLMMAAAQRQTGHRSSSCCFRDGIIVGKNHETSGTSEMSPPASEAGSGPTSVDILTPNAASCSSSTSNESAGALYPGNASQDTSTVKSAKSPSKRKSADLVQVVQGFFRPEGILLKSKYGNHSVVTAGEQQQPPSNSIYRELFGNNDVVSPILPHLDFLDAAGSTNNQSLVPDRENGSVYRSQSTAVYNIPVPFQYQHVGGDGEVMPVANATNVLVNMPTHPVIERKKLATPTRSPSELPLELQGDLV